MERPVSWPFANRLATRTRLPSGEHIAHGERDHERIVLVLRLPAGGAEPPVSIRVDPDSPAAGGPATPAGARLAGMRDFYDFVQEELPLLLRRWQKEKG